MNAQNLRRALFSTLFVLQLAASARVRAETLTFDSFSPGQNSIPIPNGHGGLQWNNFGVYCGGCRPASEGYHAGMVSPKNVAFNLYGDPASISSSNAFDLISANLTAALNLDSSLQVRVQGFSGANQVYDNTYVVTRHAPSFVNFNYLGVDRVTFTTSPTIQFAMDDLVITFPGGCNYSILPGGRLHGAGSETGTVSVATETGCTWSVVNTNAWVTILSALSSSNSGTVTYSVASNSTPQPRSGVINIASQSFSVIQSSTPSPAVIIGTVETSTLGHSFVTFGPPPGPGPRTSLVSDFLVDQNQSSGGGGVLPSVSVNWDTNSQFVLTVAAPPKKRFMVQVPAGRAVAFGGFMEWESTRGGSSPVGPVAVSFSDLEGPAPDFFGSDAVLSSSHGYFGFSEITSGAITNDFSFTSVTFTGNALPQYTGNRTENYVPHSASSLQLSYTTSATNDPGPFVSIASMTPAPAIQVDAVRPDGVALSVRGQAKGTGRTVVVECSEDLIHWTPISTNVVPCAVMDVAGASASQRFYRTLERR